MKFIHHSGYKDSEKDSTRRSFSPTPSSPSLCDPSYFVCNTDLYPDNTLPPAPPSRQCPNSTSPSSPKGPQNDVRRATILRLTAKIEVYIPLCDVGDAIRSLWQGAAVQEAVCGSREFYLNDSTVSTSTPSTTCHCPCLSVDQDILRSRVRTTFKVGELTYKLQDVGGQRSEQKKWIEGVTALAFLVSLSE